MLLQAGAGPESILLERGILGLAVLVLGSGFIYLGRRLVKERDDLAAQRESMIRTVLEVVPLVQRMTEDLANRKVLDERNLELKNQMADIVAEDLRLKGELSSIIGDFRRALERIT